jgi:N-acetyl-anhydromuramyl-L-alanine amidase AmpD
MNQFIRGAKGQHVGDLQAKLIELGYQLPRFGAYRDLGSETITALEHWWIDVDEEDAEDGIQDSEVPRVCMEFLRHFDDAKGRTPKSERMVSISGDKSNVKGLRWWSNIDSIVLHQTACLLPTQASWRPVPIHIGIPRSSSYLGKFFQLHPLTVYLYHANALNAHSVGIEIEGNFCGLESDRSTWWSPGGGPHRLEEQQIEACRAAILYIVREAMAGGGGIRKIHAHRQSSGSRRGDPGEAIWKAIGIWAIDTLKLTDGGAFKLGTGYQMPDRWTGRKDGTAY